MNKGYRRFISPLYFINIVIQAFISLVSPMLLLFLAAWLLVKYASMPSWIYVIFIVLGVFSGLYSMVVFIIRSSRVLEMIEKQNSPSKEDSHKKNEFK